MGKSVFVLALIALLVLTLISFSVEAKEKRFVSDNISDIKKALKEGCSVDSGKKLSIIECDEKSAEKLNLISDIEVSAEDVAVNELVGVYKVQDKNKVKNYTGKNVKVAVIDSGIDYTNTDLESSYAGGYDFVNYDNDPMDDNGHGTLVSGLITSDGILNRNGRGIAPDAEIVAIKVLNAQNMGYLGDIVNGIYIAVDDYHADVISISIGTMYPYLYKDYCDSDFLWVKNAIDYARGKNVPVVVSAGNYNSFGLSAPGCISSSISVGATDFDKTITYFSSKGKGVDIVTPGQNVLSTYFSNSYTRASGTSFSAPVVSGFIALMKNKNRNTSSDEIESALYKKSEDLGQKGKDDSYGNGFLNADSVKFLLKAKKYLYSSQD